MTRTLEDVLGLDQTITIIYVVDGYQAALVCDTTLSRTEGSVQPDIDRALDSLRDVLGLRQQHKSIT